MDLPRLRLLQLIPKALRRVIRSQFEDRRLDLLGLLHFECSRDTITQQQSRGAVVMQAVSRRAKRTRASGRRFLITSASGAMAGIASALPAAARAAAPDLEKLPYIDSHSHVWSPDTKRWPL